MVLRFAGKHAAVVGATGVIGSHIAQAFARQGAVVSLLGRSALQQRDRLARQLAPPQLPAQDSASHSSHSSSSSPTSAKTATAAWLPIAHQFIKLDVSDAASIKQVFAGRARTATGGDVQEQQEHQFVGPVDILVNCAGISQTTFLKRTPDEELEKIVNTNLLATMLVCKHAKMQPNGKPRRP